MALRIKILCGPTASGKSARAIDIARESGGVIINADAMQVYRELRILTARPTPQDEAAVPHRLYGAVPASVACSAAGWLALARAAIDETLASGRLPIVTGGTGFYLKALMEGLSPIPPVSPAHRAEAAALWERQGDQALAALDPAMHGRLKPGDTQRHTRALAVLIATGKSLSYWQAMPREKPYPDAQFDVELLDLPRDALYARCDARFLAMLDAGALEEAGAVQAQGLSPGLPALRAVGLPELIGALEGRWDLAEATRKAQQATRNYAKRQATWFRNQLHSHTE